MQLALENALADLCLGTPIADDPDAIRAWLERHDVPTDDVDFLLETGVERLTVYRRLVRGNLRRALEVSIPRTIARLGNRFEAHFSRFLSERGPRTHYLRDVVEEFLSFVESTWANSTEIPNFLWDLARHEALRIEIAAMQIGTENAAPIDLELDLRVRFIEAARVVRYFHAVHELSPDEEDRTEPKARTVRLLVYRNPRHEVLFLELTAMAAELLEGLMDRNLTLREAMVEAAQRTGHVLDDAALAGSARLLADLADRGALLGGIQSVSVPSA